MWFQTQHNVATCNQSSFSADISIITKATDQHYSMSMNGSQIKRGETNRCISASVELLAQKGFHDILWNLPFLIIMAVAVAFFFFFFLFFFRFFFFSPQWRAADAEIKVPSGKNTELKRSPFKSWSRSVYSLTCCAYCQEFLPCLFLPFRSIHLHFFQTSLDFSCVGCG